MSCDFVFTEPEGAPNVRRGYSQSMASWLQESGDDVARRARLWINAMYSQFDDPNHALRNNLFGADDGFYGAVTSLAVHDRLRRMGYPLQCDEATAGNGRRPDLIVRPGLPDETVVECTALLDDEEASARDRQLHPLMDELDVRLGGSEWFIMVRPYGSFTMNPPPRRIADAIQRDAQQLDPDTGLQTRDYPDWNLRVDFVPSRNMSSRVRPVGGVTPFGEARVLNDDARILQKLGAKSPHYYSVSGRPFVLALSPQYSFYDEDEVLDVLYDRRTGFFGRSDSNREVDHSGLLLVTGLQALGTQPVVFSLLPNPSALCPVDPVLIGANRTYDPDSSAWLDIWA